MPTTSQDVNMSIREGHSYHLAVNGTGSSCKLKFQTAYEYILDEEKLRYEQYTAVCNWIFTSWHIIFQRRLHDKWLRNQSSAKQVLNIGLVSCHMQFFAIYFLGLNSVYSQNL